MNAMYTCLRVHPLTWLTHWGLGVWRCLPLKCFQLNFKTISLARILSFYSFPNIFNIRLVMPRTFKTFLAHAYKTVSWLLELDMHACVERVFCDRCPQECQVKLMVVVWLISWMHICYILVQYMRVINSSSNWVQYLSTGRSATLAVFQVLNSTHLMWLVVIVPFCHCTAIFTRCSYEVTDACTPKRITLNPWRYQVHMNNGLALKIKLAEIPVAYTKK